jgi:hypothetical protein
MEVKQSSGLTSNDVYDVKVFLRSMNDAIDCIKDNTTKKNAKIHYQDYIRGMMAGMHYDRFMLDKEGQVLSSGDLNVQKMYETLNFSEQVLKRYGLDSERI